MPVQNITTVGKLQEALSKHSADTPLVVCLENEEIEYFGIDHVGVQTGTPSRDAKGRAGFKFDRTGPATWLFLNITPE